MKVLAINGSHRKGRNTATMLKLVLKPLEEHGVKTELLELVELNIKPCRACNKCLRKTECSIKDDDMAFLADKMLNSDAIVIGSPVYFTNVTSLMKIFMDRTRWMHMCKNLFEGKIGAALTHAGLRNGGQELTQMILESFLLHHGFQVVSARDPESKIYNLGPMGTMFDALDGEQILWKQGVLKDTLTVKMCYSLGHNILRRLKENMN